MTTENVTTVADKRDLDQITAGWAGLVVCGLVAAIIWFFGISAVMGNSGVETSALECTPTYGIAQGAQDCVRP